MPIELYIDPTTGDLDIDGGELVLTDTPATSLYLAIAVPVGTFHGDPELGSTIPAMIRSGKPPIDQRAALEAAARSATRRLETRGVIAVEAIEVDGVHVTIHAAQFGAPYTVKLR